MGVYVLTGLVVMREDLTMMADGLHAILHIMVLSWLSWLYVHDLIIT